MNRTRQDHRRSFLKKTLFGSSLAGWQLIRAERAQASEQTACHLPTTPGRLKKIRDIEVYRSEDYYCGPGCSPVIFADGEILVGFRRAHSSGHLNLDTECCLTSSTDEGRTWSEPRVIDFGGVHNINLTLLSDGSLLYATSIVQPITKRAYELAKDNPQNFMAGGRRRLVFSSADFVGFIGQQMIDKWGRDFYALEMGVCVRRSEDRGRTWSPRYWVSPVPGAPALVPGYPAPVELRSPVIERSNGNLIFPVYAFPNPWRAVLMSSKDGGRSWSFVGEIVGPSDELQSQGANIGPNETTVQETPSGRLVAFVRNEGFLVATSSPDGGRTWLPPRQYQLWGYPYGSLRMPSGRVILAYGYRRDPMGVRARLLDPECTQIDEAEELVVRDDGGTGDLGYPQLALMTDGRAFLAYYFNNPAHDGKHVHIAATILEEV
jgi:sialidase-1